MALFSIDKNDIAEIERLIGRRNSRVAIQAAVSRTITTGVALIARRIGEEVNLKIGDIKKTINAKRGSFDKPVGSIDVEKGKPVWLGQFLTQAQARGKLLALGGGKFKQVQTTGGVRVKVRKKGTPKYPTNETLPHAFVGSMLKVSFTGVFERTGVKRVMRYGRYKGKVREVIKRKRGPSPLGVFLHARGEDGKSTLIDEVSSRLADVFQKNLSSQVDRFLKPKGEPEAQ